MVEVLSFGFMQNALLAGLLASIACGVIGTLVVVNRIVFLAGGIAHAAYGGIGLAVYMGWPVLPCTVGFSLASSMAMAAVTAADLRRSDAVIGALWAFGMAFGIILLDLSPGYTADLMSFLFGSITAVPGSDIQLMAWLDGLILAVAIWFYQDLLAISFDREFASTRGVPVVFLHFLLLALTAVAVVMVIRVVGLILVIALLTIPPYLAERFSSSLSGMMVASGCLSCVFCAAGLWLSYACNLTSGASIIAVASAAFALDAAARMVVQGAGRGGGRRYV